MPAWANEPDDEDITEAEAFYFSVLFLGALFLVLIVALAVIAK